MCMFVYHLFLPVFYVCMYVYILSYFVNKLEIWWLYLSPIENCINDNRKRLFFCLIILCNLSSCRTTHEFLFGALAELIDNARYVMKEKNCSFRKPCSCLCYKTAHISNGITSCTELYFAPVVNRVRTQS